MSELGKALFFSKFVSGMTRYEDHYPGHEQDARIVITVNIAGRLTTQMMVDTGGGLCVLHPEIIEGVWAEVQDDYVSDKGLWIRGQLFNGRIVRLPLVVRADEGQSIEVIASVFTPILPVGVEWDLPNFIGLTGFLDRIRFAVDPDPARSAFYFGSLE